MYIGHYGLSCLVKSRSRQMPLWVLFLSVQLLDLIAFVLILLGIEKAIYSPNSNPFSRTELQYLAFSHSLVGALVISSAVFAAFWFPKRRNWALILTLCVLSHWFIDLLVHSSDLPMVFDHYKVGLGLWTYPYVSFFLEIVCFVVGWIMLRKRNGFSYALVVLGILYMCGLFFGDEPDIVKNSPALRVTIVLAVNLVLISLAKLSDMPVARTA